jgi:hypothetical protein
LNGINETISIREIEGYCQQTNDREALTFQGA